MAVLTDASGTRRFDGGRTIPDGQRESFVVQRGASGPLVLRVRIDSGARGIVLHTSSVTKDLVLEPVREGTWRTATTALDGVEACERITLEARGSEYRNHHVWIERAAAVAR